MGRTTSLGNWPRAPHCMFSQLLSHKLLSWGHCSSPSWATKFDSSWTEMVGGGGLRVGHWLGLHPSVTCSPPRLSEGDQAKLSLLVLILDPN